MRPIIAEVDAHALYLLNEDRDVIKYTGDAPFKSETACLEFYSNYKEYEKNKMGRFSVFLKEDNKLLGWCGLKLNEDNEVDLGYRFFKKYWNKGFATEASIASLKYGFIDLGLDKIIAKANIRNAASIKVMRKLRMRYLKEAFLDGQKAVIYEITKGEYLKNNFLFKNL